MPLTKAEKEMWSRIQKRISQGIPKDVRVERAKRAAAARWHPPKPTDQEKAQAAQA